jgi:hypothetical protein
MPNIGHFILHSSAVSPLPAGDYVLEGNQVVAGGATEGYEGHLRVTSPRYRMPPDQILSTFPPANSEGAFEARLPQVVLRRRTLPWERAVDANRNVPWLALVLIAEGEGQLSAEVPIGQCITPGKTLAGPNDVATGVYLGVSKTVVDKVFPTLEDLPLLAHVREVDINDTELISGDDDGFMAVILSNRLPQFDRATCSPVRYLACLINLEGQTDVLPPRPLLVSQAFDAGAFVQDLRLSRAASMSNADLKIMGTGTVASIAAIDARTGGRLSGAAAPPQPSQSSAISGSQASVKASQWTYSAQQIEQTVVAAAPSDAARIARDVMGVDWRIGVEWAVLEPTYRFPVLAYWSFSCTGAGSFETLMQGLDVGLLGTLPADPAARPRPDCLPPAAGSAPPPAPPPRPDPEGTETGHIGLEFLSRRGEGLRAWYRGPATPQITERDMPDENGHLPFAHTSDQLRRVVPDGREDLSLAGAFEIGRLLALSQPSVVSGLLRWRQENFGAARAAEIAALALADTPITVPPGTKAPDLGNLITRGLVLTAAKDSAKVLAPTRPLADPGRPLTYVRGDLDEVLANGFGLDAAAIRKRAGTIGAQGALAEVTVPVHRGDFSSKELTPLKAALDETVTAVASDVLKRPEPGGVAGGPIRRQRRGPDALDRLLSAASRNGEEEDR